MPPIGSLAVGVGIRPAPVPFESSAVTAPHLKGLIAVTLCCPRCLLPIANTTVAMNGNGGACMLLGNEESNAVNSQVQWLR